MSGWGAPRVSPDGAVEVTYEADEMRMSLWVLAPVVRRTRDDRVVLSLAGTLWDAGGFADFPAPNRVGLGLREYPDGQRVVAVVVDVEAETYGIGRDAVPGRPLAGFLDGLREAKEALPPPPS